MIECDGYVFYVELLQERMPPRLSKSGLYFKLKVNSKIETRKIAIKIEGFYLRTFVELNIRNLKIAIKIDRFYQQKKKY